MSMGLRRAFTLIELVVVIAIIAVLAALLFPALGAAKARAQRTVCVNNLHQISVGIHLYLDDQNNASPGNTNAARLPFVSWTDYRQFVNNYVGIKGASSAQDKVFACPADTFFYDMSGNGRGYVPQPMHEQADHAFTSYAFNAGQFTTPARTNAPATTNNYGIAGQRLETVPHPSRTVLLAEVPAYSPYSWHQPKGRSQKTTRHLPMRGTGFVLWTGMSATRKSISTGKTSRGLTIRRRDTITNGAEIDYS